MSLAAWNVGLSAAHRVKSLPPAVEARRTGITRHTCTASLERVVLMSVGPVVKVSALFSLLAAFAFTLAPGQANAQTTLEIGIGIQNTTTNTVTGGAVLKELGLFEKHLPTTGKYKDFKYSLSWQNATSGPPITNGMMANNIQIGMMGDYPLMVNGATGQATGNETQLVAIIAYNAQGSGNGIVVHKDSPYYELADLKGKNVSVPFGSAAHGMMLRALEKNGLPPDFWNLVSQSPEIGSTNLQEKRIDAHGDFVPFAELLPFRGFARKIYDGAETKTPTFHGVVVRKDFAEKYPEIVVAYIEALMEANDWMRKNPKLGAEKVEEWTKINKEVVYIFLGPGGIHTLDPTIKPAWVDAIGANYAVLKKLNMIKDLNIKAWVNDSYVRQAYKDLGLDYDKQLASQAGYDMTGTDPVCNVTIDKPLQAGQVWIEGGDIVTFSSPACTLIGVKKFMGAGKKLNAVYLVDYELGIKVFADAAFYSVGNDPNKPEVVPFLLKRDAEAYANKHAGKLATYSEALGAINVSQ
jgi:NitT/TauT family transport system substrate-binding protein